MNELTPRDFLADWVCNNPPDGWWGLEARKVFLDLMWLVNAPPKMQFAPYALLALRKILEALIEAITVEDQPYLDQLDLEFTDAIQVLDHFGSFLEHWVTEKPEFQLPIKPQAGHPYRGFGIVNRSFYATLLNTHENENQNQTYRLLQGATFILHAALMTENTSRDAYLNASEREKILGVKNSCAYNATREVRDASLSRNVNDYSSLLSIEGLHTFYRFVQGTKSERDSSEIGQGVSQFYTLIQNTSFADVDYGKPDKRPNFSRQGGKRQHKGWHDGWISTSYRISRESVPTDTDGVDLPSFIISEIGISDDEAFERSRNDIDPHEEAVEEELMLSSSSSRAPALITSRAQVKHIATSNQQLRSDWSSATLAEMTALMKACGEIIRNMDSSPIRKEIAALMMVMTWTGSTIRQAKQLIWIGKRGNSAPTLGYRDQADSGQWYIRPHTPPFSQSTLRVDATHARNRSSLLMLPDFFRVGLYLRQVFGNETKGNHSRKIFQKKEPVYRKELLRLIRELPDGHRLNEHKVSNYLAHHIHTIGSRDIADSILITGRYRPLGQTLLHYTTPSSTYLQNLYRQVTARMVKDIYSEGYDKNPPDPKVSKEQHDVAVGNRYCPTVKALRSMTNRLTKSLASKPDHRLSAIRDYHNRFTLYTCQMIAYSTGVRAVTDPFFHTADIDSETGLAVISDKDGPDMYNSRLVWVPPVVRAQIHSYESHRELVSTLMWPLWADEQERLSHKILGAFFLDDTFNPEPVRPGTAKAHLEDLLSLPLNVNRRFLRTMLKERNANVEAINAFLGHWSRGEEPWGRFSSVAPAELIEELKPHILALLEVCGFKQINSRLR